MNKLPKLPEELRNRESETSAERIAKERDAIPADQRTAVLLSQRWLGLRAQEDDLDAKVKDLNAKLRACEQLMEAAFEDEEIKSIENHNGESVGMQGEPWAVVSNRTEYREWLMKNGFEEQLSQLLIPWQTTQSMIKDRLKSNQNPPPGIEVYGRNKFVRR